MFKYVLLLAVPTDKVLIRFVEYIARTNAAPHFSSPSRQLSGHDISCPYKCDVERDARPIRNNLIWSGEARLNEGIQIITRELLVPKFC